MRALSCLRIISSFSADEFDVDPQMQEIRVATPGYQQETAFAPWIEECLSSPQDWVPYPHA
jgi:hypothetical protein